MGVDFGKTAADHGRHRAGLYRKLAWASTWYLREDTLKDAVSAIVNFHPTRFP